MKFSNISARFLSLKSLFSVMIITAIAVNGGELVKKTPKNLTQRNNLPFYFMGIKFAGLDKTLKGVTYIGYYTDRDLSKKSEAAQFSQAQYILAPAILDPDNLDHPFALFDCAVEEKCQEKIRASNAIPLKKNQFGVILARKKQ